MDCAEPAIPGELLIPDAFEFGDVRRLTASLKRGEEAAFAWLHDEWSGRINRYCFALAAGDETFAREIAQSAWLRLVRHIRVLNDEQALWNWVACAARHAATDLRRTGGRYRLALIRFGEWWKSGGVETNADNILLAALESALDKLTDEERALVEGRYAAGESLKTIGARHALSARAVEGRLARLRIQLRERIAHELKLQIR
jgi:RNA polymerase sigma factor (sigma-70 family)